MTDKAGFDVGEEKEQLRNYHDTLFDQQHLQRFDTELEDEPPLFLSSMHQDPNGNFNAYMSPKKPYPINVAFNGEWDPQQNPSISQNLQQDTQSSDLMGRALHSLLRHEAGHCLVNPRLGNLADKMRQQIRKTVKKEVDANPDPNKIWTTLNAFSDIIVNAQAARDEESPWFRGGLSAVILDNLFATKQPVQQTQEKPGEAQDDWYEVFLRLEMTFMELPQEVQDAIWAYFPNSERADKGYEECLAAFDQLYTDNQMQWEDAKKVMEAVEKFAPAFYPLLPDDHQQVEKYYSPEEIFLPQSPYSYSDPDDPLNGHLVEDEEYAFFYGTSGADGTIGSHKRQIDFLEELNRLSKRIQLNVDLKPPDETEEIEPSSVNTLDMPPEAHELTGENLLDGILVAIDTSGSMMGEEWLDLPSPIASETATEGETPWSPYSLALLSCLGLVNWLQREYPEVQINICPFSSETKTTGWIDASAVLNRDVVSVLTEPDVGGTVFDANAISTELAKKQSTLFTLISDGDIQNVDEVKQMLLDVTAVSHAAFFEIDPYADLYDINRTEDPSELRQKFEELNQFAKLIKKPKDLLDQMHQLIRGVVVESRGTSRS